jgi:RHS repeat-associated protein
VTDANGTRTDYLVDGQNRRVGKSIAGTLVQGFLWLNQNAIAAELDGSGNVVSRFVYAGESNAPAYLINGGHLYRIITDPLGSPRLVVDDATGNVAQRIDYDAFGRVTQDTNPGFQPFGFAAGLYDPRTSLVRFGARDYDPAVGRWATRDPILFRGGDTNLYGYVVNDPVDFTDPGGLATFDCRVVLGSDARNPKDPKDLIGPFFHEYLCVVDDVNLTVTCGGQGNTGSDVDPGKWLWWNVPGVNDSRGFNRKHCPLIDKRQCFDKCATEIINGTRPPFNDFNNGDGINCQRWAEDVLEYCRIRCQNQ